jgi:16S rRNA (cytidine1402-2'-O)-methyltransferase
MLYIVATPIGNLEDITLRALRILKEVDFILAEDTRKTGILLKHFGIKKPLYSFYEHNELKRLPWVLEQLKNNKNIALVSNAGVPTICDPGYKLVRECQRQKLLLTSVPGPCSVINALVLSSLPHDKFAFLGYLPKKKNDIEKILLKASSYSCTVGFFESPFRIKKSLEIIREVLGNKQVVLAREMTKKFEEVLEFSVDDAIAYLESRKPRGEYTLLLDTR